MNQYSRIFCKDIQATITTADLTRTAAISDAEIEFSSFVNLMSLKKSHKYAPLQMDSQNWHLHISSFKVYKLFDESHWSSYHRGAYQPYMGFMHLTMLYN